MTDIETQRAREVRYRVLYFAVLRDMAGCDVEEIASTAQTPRQLYEELAERHQFRLSQGHLRAAVNGDFVSFDALLLHGDEVAFIPPVAGGAP